MLAITRFIVSFLKYPLKPCYLRRKRVENTWNECRMSSSLSSLPNSRHVRMDWIHSCIQKRKNRSIYTSMQPFRTLFPGYCYICRVTWHCRQETLCSCNMQLCPHIVSTTATNFFKPCKLWLAPPQAQSHITKTPYTLEWC